MSTPTSSRIKVASESDLLDEAGVLVKAGDTAVALFRIQGHCYAIANACPHRGGPLAEGDLEDYVVHCPWHGWSWDVRTGLNIRQPENKVACFPVTVEDGSVYIELKP